MRRQTDRDPYRGRDPREIPAYDTCDAAHYLRIPENTIRNWAFGRAYSTRAGGQAWAKPLIGVADTKRHLLSFVNLLELHVLGALRRDHHVDMINIRRAIEYMRRKLPSPYPLIDLDVETDGTDIFVNRYRQLINASQHGQLAMKALLEDHLRRIERNEKGIAIRLFPFTRPRVETSPMADPPRLVSIDPSVAFGRPVIAGSRVPTIEVFERFKAGEQPDELADDFGRTKEEILEAIRCEAEAA